MAAILFINLLIFESRIRVSISRRAPALVALIRNWPCTCALNTECNMFKKAKTIAKIANKIATAKLKQLQYYYFVHIAQPYFWTDILLVREYF